MADQGTPSRDTEQDKDLDESYDVADNHEEQPTEAGDAPERDPDGEAESPDA